MKQRHRIALIGFSTLEYLGLRSILENYDDVSCEEFRSGCFVGEEISEFDGFIADVCVVGMMPEFFTSRRSRVLTIGRSMTTVSDDRSKMADKDGDEAELTAAVERLIEQLRKNDAPMGLSTREKDVLKLVAQGHINKEIADRLCISVNTVITHRKNIASKLGIKSASGLSLYAMMNGLLEK